MLRLCQQVFEAAALLPRLAHLDVRSAFLHVHNAAVAALGRCAALRRLTLQLPAEWPSVTGAPPRLRDGTSPILVFSYRIVSCLV